MSRKSNLVNGPCKPGGAFRCTPVTCDPPDNEPQALVCYSKGALDRIGREQVSPSNSKTAR